MIEMSQEKIKLWEKRCKEKRFDGERKKLEKTKENKFLVRHINWSKTKQESRQIWWYLIYRVEHYEK